MRPQYSFIATITIVLYILASCFGYLYYLENPKGILLYTPPAHGDINYTPAFSVGVSLVLLISGITATVIALLALFSRCFLASESLRVYTLTLFKGGLLVAMLCLPGIFFAESIWQVFNP